MCRKCAFFAHTHSVTLFVCLRPQRIIEKELEGFGIRLNQKPPAIILKKKEKGGLAITKAVQLTKLDNKMITAIAKEYKM